ncbi:MAG: hypothetical protein NUK62_06975 [Tenericutes bacterium]|nr:hypothetical protein [Mycoplasmatota bacterium]
MRKTHFLFIFLFLFLILLSGCSSLPEGITQDEYDFFLEYGRDKAYLHTDDGRMITNGNPTSIIYYTGDLPYSYRKAMENAAFEYSQKLEPYIEIITNMSLANSSYKAQTHIAPPLPPGGGCDNPIGCDTQIINLKSTNGLMTLAYNNPEYDSVDDSKIVGSLISFDASIMYYFTQKEKDNTALHELGHTFGLADVFDEIYKNKTTMYGVYGTGVNPTAKLYTLDEANLRWYYEHGYTG